jgi:Restriction endonuclease fold toxin 5
VEADGDEPVPLIATFEITGRRPLPPTAEELAGLDTQEVTTAGAATLLLTPQAATGVLRGLGVSAQALELVAAGGRLALAVGGRVIGYAIPGVGVVMLAYTAYQIMDAAERNARGAPFFADDGTLQRYAPSADPLSSSLVLERFEPSASASPEEADGRWVAVGYVTPLSDEERRRLLGPLTTPIPDPQPPPIFVNIPPVVPQAQEGFDIGPPTMPLPGFDPGPTLTIDDIILENRQRADDASRANPDLRTPSSVVGTTDGGPGEWDYSPTRSAGEKYQEQITGVPRGIEYEVNGVWFDGYDAEANVLLDAKDWVNYPPEDTEFWQKGVVKEAEQQVRAAAGTGARIEWRVATQEAADALTDLFAANDQLRGKIDVVVVPRKP